jgi:hypothetical protein
MKAINREKLLEQLDRIKYSKDEEDRNENLGQMNLGGVLLTLTKIDHEHEYEACHDLAEHVLGAVPKPEEDDFEDVLEGRNG